jgi:hypothetical protein
MADYTIRLTALEDAAMAAYIADINPTEAEPYADINAYVQRCVRRDVDKAVAVFNEKDRASFIARYDIATLEERAAAKAVLPVPKEPEPEPVPVQPVEREGDLVVSRQ